MKKIIELASSEGLMLIVPDDVLLSEAVKQLTEEALKREITPNCITFDCELTDEPSELDWTIILWGQR